MEIVQEIMSLTVITFWSIGAILLLTFVGLMALLGSSQEEIKFHMVTVLIVIVAILLIEIGGKLNKVVINANGGMPVMWGKVAFIVPHSVDKVDKIEVRAVSAKNIKYPMLADMIFDWHYFLGDETYGVASPGDFFIISGPLLLGTWLYYLALLGRQSFPFLLRLFYFSSGYLFLYSYWLALY